MTNLAKIKCLYLCNAPNSIKYHGSMERERETTTIKCTLLDNNSTLYITEHV